MKNLLLTLVACAALFAAEGGSKPEQEVLAAMDAWKQAMLHQDRAALDKLLHPDLTYTHSSGRMETKAETIDGAMKNKYQVLDVKETKVRVYGNSALVTSKMDILTAGNNGQTNHLMVLNVWVKTPQGWRLVGRQATKLS